MNKFERRCICGHCETTHIVEHLETICAHAGCKCNQFFLWEVHLLDPMGNLHIICDVDKFVRDRDDLFTTEEREIHGIKTKNGNRSENSYTRAGSGLSKLTQKQQDSWHGWTIARYPKTYIEPS